MGALLRPVQFQTSQLSVLSTLYSLVEVEVRGSPLSGLLACAWLGTNPSVHAYWPDLTSCPTTPLLGLRGYSQFCHWAAAVGAASS